MFDFKHSELTSSITERFLFLNENETCIRINIQPVKSVTQSRQSVNLILGIFGIWNFGEALNIMFISINII